MLFSSNYKIDIPQHYKSQCANYYRYFFDQFPALYKNNNFHAIDSLLNLSQFHCINGFEFNGKLELIKILVDIKRNSFSNSVVDTEFVESVLNDYYYEKSFSFINSSSFVDYYSFPPAFQDSSYFEYLISERKFLDYVIEISNDLLTDLPDGSDEYLICYYLSNPNENIFKSIDHPKYANTQFKNSYDSLLKSIKKISETRFALISGIWVPQDNTKLLGNHPVFGFLTGYRKSLIFIDLTLIFRFSDSENKYQYLDDENLILTNHYFGGYLGLDLGNTVINLSNHKLDFRIGFGYDGFDANKKKEDDHISISSVNYNCGFDYRYHLKKYSPFFVGLQFRYNIVDYENKGGTDFSGNSLSFRIFIGGDGNREKSKKLEILNSW